MQVRAWRHHNLERFEAGKPLVLTTVTLRSAERKDESASWEMPSSVITSMITGISLPIDGGYTCR